METRDRGFNEPAIPRETQCLENVTYLQSQPFVKFGIYTAFAYGDAKTKLMAWDLAMEPENQTYLFKNNTMRQEKLTKENSWITGWDPLLSPMDVQRDLVHRATSKDPNDQQFILTYYDSNTLC